jgi:hypothetical protein
MSPFSALLIMREETCAELALSVSIAYVIISHHFQIQFSYLIH